MYQKKVMPHLHFSTANLIHACIKGDKHVCKTLTSYSTAIWLDVGSWFFYHEPWDLLHSDIYKLIIMSLGSMYAKNSIYLGIREDIWKLTLLVSSNRHYRVRPHVHLLWNCNDIRSKLLEHSWEFCSKSVYCIILFCDRPVTICDTYTMGSRRKRCILSDLWKKAI